MKKIKILLLAFIAFILINENSQAQVFNYHFNSPLNETGCKLYIIGNSMYFAYQIENTPINNQTLYFKIIKANLQGEIIDSLIIDGTPGYLDFETMLLFNNNFYIFNWKEGEITEYSKYSICKIDTGLHMLENKEYSNVMHYIVGGVPVIFNNKIYLFNHGNFEYNIYGPYYNQIVLFNEFCDTLSTNLNLPYLPFFDSQFWPIKVIDIPNETNFYCFHGSSVQKFDTSFLTLWSNQKFINYDEPYLSLSINNHSSVFWKDDTTLTIITGSEYTNPNNINDYWQPITIFDIDTTFSPAVINPDLDPVIFGNHDNITNQLAPVIKISGGDYIIATFILEDITGEIFGCIPNVIHILRYTSDRNFVWEKIIGNADSTYYVEDIINMGDGFIIWGNRYNMNGNPENYDIFFYKFDYDGNFYKIMELPGGKVWARVFPNPGQDYFNLECSNSFTGADLLLYDMSGQQVLQQKIKGSEQKIFTGNLSPGSYVYSIQQNGATVYSGKWEKQK
ncbi:MAG: T9SS type A sorting domain-containing protein [Bacteroidia bacterium]|nr:T9SS type A sorting domain-containing protein [Bacteroidia bacterium]